MQNVLNKEYFAAQASTMNLDSRCLVLIVIDAICFYITGDIEYSQKNYAVPSRIFIERNLDITPEQIAGVVIRKGGDAYLMDKERALKTLADSLHGNKQRSFCREILHFFLVQLEGALNDSVWDRAKIEDVWNNYVDKILKNRLFG